MLMPYSQRAIGRNDDDLIRLNRHAVLGFYHQHAGDLSQKLGQDALVVRSEVLHEDECHAAVRRHAGEEGFKCGKAARRSAYAYDQAHLMLRVKVGTGPPA